MKKVVICNLNSIFYSSIVTINSFFGLNEFTLGGGKGVGGLLL